jgi:hypothetical protein
MNSSWIESVSYDGFTQQLSVATKDGETYDYQNVPQAKADGLESASSKGAYHNTEIRGNFDYQKR